VTRGQKGAWLSGCWIWPRHIPSLGKRPEEGIWDRRPHPGSGQWGIRSSRVFLGFPECCRTGREMGLSSRAALSRVDAQSPESHFPQAGPSLEKRVEPGPHRTGPEKGELPTRPKTVGNGARSPVGGHRYVRTPDG
jgi:hypothetical protein